MVVLLGSATQVFAQSACPARGQNEATRLFRDRTHSYCEGRWQALVSARDTGGQSHDQFINVCARKCYGDVGAQVAGSQLAVIGGIVGAGAIAGVAAAASSGHGAPASP